MQLQPLRLASLPKSVYQKCRKLVQKEGEEGESESKPFDSLKDRLFFPRGFALAGAKFEKYAEHNVLHSKMGFLSNSFRHRRVVPTNRVLLRLPLLYKKGKEFIWIVARSRKTLLVG